MGRANLIGLSGPEAQRRVRQPEVQVVSGRVIICRFYMYIGSLMG